MNHSPALLLCCLTLAGSLLAQDPDKTGKIRTPVAGATEETTNADEKAQAGDGEVTGDGEVKGRPTGRTDLPRFCDFIGSARPSPLPPGASGTFHVIAILKGDGVISDTSKVQLDYQRQQGPLTLGEPIWPSAKPGKLAAAFQGRPVFEDTLVVSIPITVGAGVAFGTYPVQANVTATLTQGSNGVVIGELKTLVNAQLKVGEAVLGNVPVVRPAAPVATEPPADSTAGRSPAANAAATGRPAATGNQPIGQALDPEALKPGAASTPDAADEATDQVPMAEKEGMPLLLLVGGGFVLLIGIVLVLARRK